MALYPCNIGSNGGTSETVLWTNSNPSASFSGGTVTLSESIENFDFIEFTVNRSRTDSTSLSSMISVEEFNKCTGALVFVCCMHQTSDNSNTARTITKSSNTTISFSNAASIGVNWGTGDRAIPVKIKGIKYG